MVGGWGAASCATDDDLHLGRDPAEPTGKVYYHTVQVITNTPATDRCVVPLVRLARPPLPGTLTYRGYPSHLINLLVGPVRSQVIVWRASSGR